MMRFLTVPRATRVAHLRDGEVVRVLAPGRHVVPTWPGVHEYLPFDTTAPLVALDATDPLPDVVEGATLVEVAPGERVVRLVQGAVTQVLGPGRYRVWDDGDRSELVRVDILAEPIALDRDDRLEPAVPGAWDEATASAFTALVLRGDNEPIRALQKGRYRVFRGGPWTVVPLHLGLRPLELAIQDLVTRDQVTVRVRPMITWRVADPVLRLTEPQGESQLYAAVQLALREVVAARELDALVADRDALSTDLLARAREAMPEVGIALEAAWVKDITLPAEVKALLNRVTLARKEAEALSIRRREEVAATRQLANTAKLLDKNPVLLRLKELEALGEVVGKIDKLVVVGTPELLDHALLRDRDH